MRDHKNIYPGFEPKYDNDGYPDLPKEPTVTIPLAKFLALTAAAKAVHDIYHHSISERPTDIVMGATINIVREALAALCAAGIQIEKQP